MPSHLGEDVRPGSETPLVKQPAGSREDGPELLPLPCAEAILPPEPRDLGVGIRRADLPGVDDVRPFGDEKPGFELAARFRLRRLGERAGDLLLGSDLRPTPEGELEKFLGDAAERRRP